MIARLALPLALAALASPLAARPLTVKPGEDWLFTIERGQPVHARKVAPATPPKKGEVHVAVRRMLGTTLTMTSRAARGYRFRVDLVKDGKATASRACELPADGKPVLEHWSQPADALRLSDFRPVAAGGACPDPR